MLLAACGDAMVIRTEFRRAFFSIERDRQSFGQWLESMVRLPLGRIRRTNK